MKVRLLYFAVLRERLGLEDEAFEFAGNTLAELRSAIAARHPSVASVLPRVAFAVGEEYAGESTELREGAEVALIPPIAGGAPDEPRKTRLRGEELTLDEVIAEVAWPGAGALVTFTGVVRHEARGRAVTRLEYEAYPAMAELKLAEVEANVLRRWPVVRCAVRHRVGSLAVGEPAVVIAVSAPHRHEAFVACEFAIDELKRTVPLWKKETGEGGSTWVEECVPGARAPEQT